MATAVEAKVETLSFVPSPTVPVVGDLASVYTEAVPEERYNKITTAFELAFGSKPEFYARAPGKSRELTQQATWAHARVQASPGDPAVPAAICYHMHNEGYAWPCA